MRPRYAITSAPPMQAQKGPLGHFTDFAKSQALSRGIDMAFPGGGIAKDAATYMAPRMFNQGGPAAGRLCKEYDITPDGQLYCKTFQDGVLAPQTRTPEDVAGLAVPGGGRTAEDVVSDVDRARLREQKVYDAVKGGADPAAYGVYFNMGGPIGGGLKKSELMEARQMGALSQKEFLKAMEHGGYLKNPGPLAGVKYKQTGGKVTHESEIKYHNPLAGGGSD